MVILVYSCLIKMSHIYIWGGYCDSLKRYCLENEALTVSATGTAGGRQSPVTASLWAFLMAAENFIV